MKKSALFLGFALAACGQMNGQQSSLSDSIHPDTQAYRQAEANNEFAIKLYQESFAKIPPNARVLPTDAMISPYSVSSALAMTYLGADGKTASEMRDVLKFADTPSFANSFSRLNDLVAAQTNRDGYLMNIANRIWAQSNFSWLPEFLNVTKASFTGSEPQSMNFRGDAEGSRNTINKWVEQKTNNKITNLLPQGVINEDTRMVLTNAVYFLGEWASKFDEKATVKDFGFKSPKGEVKVEMMRSTSPLRLPYVANDRYQAIQLPYKARDLKKSASMVVLLPNEGQNVFGVEQSLNAKEVSALFDSLKKTKISRVNLQMPKWKTETTLELNDVLKSLGVKSAFDEEKANFGKMADLTKTDNLYISKVLHKTFVSVTEGGTEAAGATAVIIMERTSAPLDQVVQFVADRPFTYMIKDDATGSILFMGRFAGLSK